MTETYTEADLEAAIGQLDTMRFEMTSNMPEELAENKPPVRLNVRDAQINLVGVATSLFALKPGEAVTLTRVE